MTDLVVTWPKSRPLQSYLDEVERALEWSRVVNFRIGSPPLQDVADDRCYRVYDGFVRGWLPIVEIAYRDPFVVKDPITNLFWPEGHYIVCRPVWHSLAEPVPMKGFQGWRYASNVAELTGT